MLPGNPFQPKPGAGDNLVSIRVETERGALYEKHVTLQTTIRVRTTNAKVKLSSRITIH
jgi:hypothetical protein